MAEIDINKANLCAEIDRRVEDKILESTNGELLKKLINNADDLNEAISIASLGTMYKRTGLHYDVRLEKSHDNNIRYFKKNESLSFHQDDSKPTHKLIIGDNYEALQNLLIEYRNIIDVIYIDPPYGKDSMGEFAQTNYDNAISRDNLLSMLYPRLILARDLLSNEGVIFCSIDDKNHAYVKCLFDEVFQEKNYVTSFIWQSTPGSNTGTDIKTVTEYILLYSKNHALFTPNTRIVEDDSKYTLTDEYVERRGGYCLNKLDRRMTGSHYSEALNYAIQTPDGTMLYPGSSVTKQEHWNWRWSAQKVQWGIENDFIVFKKVNNEWSIYFKQYWKVDNNDNQITRALPYQNLLNDDDSFNSARGSSDLMKIMGGKVFAYPKPVSLIVRLLEIVTNESSIVFDFFAGSGTTAHAICELNRKGGDRTAILCQLDEGSEKQDETIAHIVTAKRLKRIMTGECYDGTKDFPWLKDNIPYGDNLDVYEIASVPDFETTPGRTAFDVIDETLYGKHFVTMEEKVKWVCDNFKRTETTLKEKK